jgi:hypothetical protein
MTDVILIATIVAFFVAAAFLVKVLDRVVTGSGDDAGPEQDGGPEQDEAPRPELQLGQRAGGRA